MKTKTDETLLLAETLFAGAWGHDPKADANELVSRALEAAITFDERIERLKANGLAAATAKEPPEKPSAPKLKRRAR